MKKHENTPKNKTAPPTPSVVIEKIVLVDSNVAFMYLITAKTIYAY